jgi:hypothetical protein
MTPKEVACVFRGKFENALATAWVRFSLALLINGGYRSGFA